MKKKHCLPVSILCMLVILSALGCTSVAQPSIPTDAKGVVVIDVKQVNFNTVIESNLAWFPGEKYSVAAMQYRADKGTLVSSYNLETGEIKQIYNLRDYGNVGLGNGINFFWSGDGKRIVTGGGGVANLEKKSGYWIKLPEGFRNPNVEAMSLDGKKLFVDGSSDKVFGSYVMDIDNEEFHQFVANLAAFSPPLLPASWKPIFYPLAWSPNGKWFVVETYDPDHPPKNITENVPGALYLLRTDGQEARLIARNIEGRIDAVTFSPDGSKLIWEEARNGKQYIYIANLDGSGMHEIFSNVDLSTDANIASNLLWSPDGMHIVYMGPHDKDYNYPFWILTLGNVNSVIPTP